MSETTNPGEKKLSISGKTLTLKPRSETGTVRQSFSHGRSKQVVVEKVKRRVVGGETKMEAPPAAEPLFQFIQPGLMVLRVKIQLRERHVETHAAVNGHDSNE